MRAVVFHAIGNIRVEDVPEPTIEDPQDAIVRLTASAICGTDLHFVRGTFSGMKKGQILGHEGVGIIGRLAWLPPSTTSRKGACNLSPVAAGSRRTAAPPAVST